ncbi:MAG TPA: DUF2846 domain-containing protein [Rectinemataceae bacterium]|nr:DUF2846 domain-containing protein [Rectinemataceae bacterium]
MLRAERLVLLSAAAVLVCAAFFSCATVPPASPQASVAEDASAKQFVPPAGKADIYIVRSRDLVSFGQVEPFMIEVDGRMIGYLAPGMFFLVPVEPGRHEITAASMAGIDRIGMSTAAGENHFYQASEGSSSDSSSSGRPSLGILLIPGLAKMQIQQSRLAQSSAP